MEPLLFDNDKLIFKKISFGRIKVNDCILTSIGENLITHRVIYKTSRYLITRGDNNLKADNKVYPHQIIGLLTQIKRGKLLFRLDDLYLMQSTQYFDEITSLFSKFQKQAISVVLLKGLPLHLYYQKTHPRKIFVDCDILIHPVDFIKIHKLLIKNGYHKERTGTTDTGSPSVEINYLKIINGLTVIFDIHLEPAFFMVKLPLLTALFPQTIVREISDELHNSVRTVLINNTPFPLLSPKYLIFYLALHFFHHNYQGVHRLEFLHEVTRRHLKELSQVAELIVHHKLADFAYPVFFLMLKYYSSPREKKVVQHLLTQLKPHLRHPDILVQVIKRACVFDKEQRGTAGVERFRLFFMLSPNPWWRKIWVFSYPQVFLLTVRVLCSRIYNYLYTLRITPIRSN